MTHPWHDIDPGQARKPTAFIEIPKNSRHKYELDKPTGLVRLDRVLFSPFVYPFNYGFIPRTLAKDNDPLDIFVLGDPLISMSIVTITPVGMLEMVDEGKTDDKVISLPVCDPRYTHIQCLEDLSPHHLKELEHFLSRYKDLEKKTTTVMEWKGAEETIEEIQRSMEEYERVFQTPVPKHAYA